MRASTTRILLCAAAIFFASASIGVSDERRQLTLRFAEAWKSDALVQTVAKLCGGTNSGPFDPKSAYHKDPPSFGGVSPESKYWPEVELAYSKYQIRMCTNMSANDFAVLYAEIMTSTLSDDELRESTAFFSSSAGKGIIKANAKANEEFMRRTGDKFQKLAAEMWSETRLEVMAIAEKYKKNPQ